jgi:hypothetical protein
MRNRRSGSWRRTSGRSSAPAWPGCRRPPRCYRHRYLAILRQRSVSTDRRRSMSITVTRTNHGRCLVCSVSSTIVGRSCANAPHRRRVRGPRLIRRFAMCRCSSLLDGQLRRAEHVDLAAISPRPNIGTTRTSARLLKSSHRHCAGTRSPWAAAGNCAKTCLMLRKPRYLTMLSPHGQQR